MFSRQGFLYRGLVMLSFYWHTSAINKTTDNKITDNKTTKQQKTF